VPYPFKKGNPVPESFEAEHIEYRPDFNKQDNTFDFEEQEAV